MQRSTVGSATTRGGAGRQLALPAGGDRSRRQSQGRRLPVAPRAGLFDNLFDFESWAPRSSRAWRLGQNPNAQPGEAAKREMQEQDVDVLNQRLAEARQSEVAGGGGMAAAEAPEPDAAAGEEGQPSFLKSTDEEVASALADRIAAMAAVQGSGGGDGGALTGPLLKELLLSKWGKAYDLSFVRRDPPLGKTLICLNVMWTHLEQRSFPMTEEEYDEKLDLMALYLNSWGQAERVESFLRQPARPQRGLPSKPIVGVAVSIQLDLEDAIVQEYFAQGGA